LRKRDKGEQRRLLAAIDDLANDPRPASCKKLSGHENLWRIRVGAFRIVYRINDRNLLRGPISSESPGGDIAAPSVILVLTIGHRRDIYEQVQRL
jgi:mRNA interferase RelE/StbE